MPAAEGLKMKTGRNDPCPCGSGRKFKHCCLAGSSRPETDSPPQADDVLSIESQQYCGLVEKLVDFMDRPGNRQDLKKALMDFLPDAPYSEFELDWAGQVFHLWYMHFRPDKNFETLNERFLRTHRHSLSPAERAFLDEMGRERFRLMEVREVRPSVGLTLTDLHSGEAFEVRERSASQSLVPWDIILTRLRRFSTHNELDMAVPLVRGAKTPMLNLLAEILQTAPPDAPEAAIQYLMTFGMAHVFSYVVMLNRQASMPPEMRNSDGDELVICTARYSVMDIDAVRDAFCRHRSFRGNNSGDGFIWISGSRKMPGGRTDRVSLGTVQFDGRDLILETNSEPRQKKGKALLEKVAGEWIRHRGDSFEDFDQIMASAKMAKGQNPDPEIPPEVETQILAQFFQQYYLEQWPNAPVPALNGLTPIQAAADPRWKNQVVELVKGIENGMARDPKANFDINRLWNLLRLERS